MNSQRKLLNWRARHTLDGVLGYQWCATLGWYGWYAMQHVVTSIGGKDQLLLCNQCSLAKHDQEGARRKVLWRNVLAVA
jgi:hypothetical protein